MIILVIPNFETNFFKKQIMTFTLISIAEGEYNNEEVQRRDTRTHNAV